MNNYPCGATLRIPRNHMLVGILHREKMCRIHLRAVFLYTPPGFGRQSRVLLKWDFFC